MTTFKKRMIRFLILGGIIGLGVFGWIQYTLYQSRATADQIGSRSVTSSQPTDSTPEYFQEQQAMIDRQGVIEQVMDTMDTQEVLAQGSFNRLDPIHRAEGMIEVIGNNEKVFLQFPSDFKSANGPDLYVVLTLGNTYDEQTSLNLGPLVDTQGEQVYKISRDEREQYKNGSLIIWCRAFDVDFSVAGFE